MAIPELSFGEGGHLDVRHGQDPATATIPFPVRLSSVPSGDDLPSSWFNEHHEARALALLEQLERALVEGRTRRVERLRRAFLATVHADRLARATSLAREHDLRLDPTGQGPVFHRPALFMRDRLPWWVRPVDARVDGTLPDRAKQVLRQWEAQSDVFDAYYHADEPTGGSPLRCHCLIGVLSCDGLSGDWFVLDRWGT